MSMAWNQIDPRLRLLYNAVAKAHNELTSSYTAQKSEEEAVKLMEDLTEKLKNSSINKRHIENIVWHIETNRSKIDDTTMLDDVFRSLKSILKEAEV